MSTPSTKCPKCGAPEWSASMDKTFFRFKCYSVQNGEQFIPSETCELTTLRTSLEKAKEALTNIYRINKHEDYTYDQKEEMIDREASAVLKEIESV